MPIPNELAKMTEQDLLDLIAADVCEGKTLEYKREISIGTPDQKRKFIRSVASFANASGGHIIFGIDAPKGRPLSLTPHTSGDPDGAVRILRDIARAHVQPPLLGVDYHPIIVSGGWALVIRVPRSWNSPHMVTFEADNRFYTRDANGCIAMSVPELRDTFLVGKEINERTHQYRLKRLSSIRAGELPMILEAGALTVLHAIAVRPIIDAVQVEIGSLLEEQMIPLGEPQGWGKTYDIDGVYSKDQLPDGTCGSYFFVDRSGCIEATTSRLSRANKTGGVIFNPTLEGQIFEFVIRIQALFQKLCIEPPVMLGLSLLNIRNYVLGNGPNRPLYGMRPIQQSDLVFPLAMMTSFGESHSKILKPVCDALWNSCGLPRSLNFDVEGQWKPGTWN